jgi:hypothetical protein
MTSFRLFSQFFVVLVCVSNALTSLAAVKIVQSKAGSVIEVDASAVEATCGKNFVFREAKRDEAPAYLHKEIIKAAFKGDMAPSIEVVVSALKANSGKCAWVTPDEFATTK